VALGVSRYFGRFNQSGQESGSSETALAASTSRVRGTTLVATVRWRIVTGDPVDRTGLAADARDMTRSNAHARLKTNRPG
jgi:hypothetical protein